MVRARAQRRGRMPHVCAGKPSRNQQRPMKSKHLYKAKDWQFQTWVFPKPNGTPKSSILIIGFSIINYHHPFWGFSIPPIFGSTPPSSFFLGGSEVVELQGWCSSWHIKCTKTCMLGVRWVSCGSLHGFEVGLLV